MKLKFIQKVMAGALAVTLAVTPSMSAFAAYGNEYGNEAESGSSEAQVVEIVNDEGAEVSSVAQIPASSSVAGTKTTTRGVYLATVLNGAAVRSSVANIASAYNLAAGETPYVRMYNMDTKKSNLAAAAINSAAASVGGTVCAYVNVDLGKMSGGKFSLLPSDGATIELSFGIPRSAVQAGKTFAVVCVRPGGAVSILQDVDDNPNTVTFNTTGGQGAYAIIKY